MASNFRTWRSSGSWNPACTARPATARPRWCPSRSSRTCGSGLQGPCVPIALAMPFVDPEHHHAQRERYGPVIDFRANIGFVSAVGCDQGLVEHRQAANLGQLFERRVDRTQGLLLAAVVVAQD